MKKSITVLLGVCLSVSSVYAGSNHVGDHMHEGKMTNHSNPNSMTNRQISNMDNMNNNANNHQGDHMHEGKMANHSNPNRASSKELNIENGTSHESN